MWAARAAPQEQAAAARIVKIDVARVARQLLDEPLDKRRHGSPSCTPDSRDASVLARGLAPEPSEGARASGAGRWGPRK